MSEKLFDTMAPFDYQTMNYYNSQRSPSTVHVKNTRLRRYFRKYLFQKAISVFKWNLPDEWDDDYFRYTLHGMGYIAVLETESFGKICQGGALGGYNLYYRPSYIIITNPMIKNTITAKIDIDCAIIKLQPDYSSIMDIVGFYADLMAIAAETAGINILNVKNGTVFGAESKAQAESYKKMYDMLSAGDPAIVVDKKMFDEQGKPSWFPFTQNIKESYVASDILSDLQKIDSMFCEKIGITNNANPDKRERLITSEVESNNEETKCLADLWLEEIRKGLTKANEMFNLNLTCDWRFKQKGDWPE